MFLNEASQSCQHTMVYMSSGRTPDIEFKSISASVMSSRGLRLFGGYEPRISSGDSSKPPVPNTVAGNGPLVPRPRRHSVENVLPEVAQGYVGCVVSFCTELGGVRLKGVGDAAGGVTAIGGRGGRGDVGVPWTGATTLVSWSRRLVVLQIQDDDERDNRRSTSITIDRRLRVLSRFGAGTIGGFEMLQKSADVLLLSPLAVSHPEAVHTV
ncbi:hypothetical protein QBC39DRAFT_430422 [Podospora conica]|nr:hypothetical protein QBC39DRAFT_430422 [Schizothecium conicum]